MTGLVCGGHSTDSSTRNRQVHSLRNGWLHSCLQITWWQWGDRTYCLVLLIYVGQIRIRCILSRDVMLARYMPSSCVRLCGMDVAYQRRSDWTCLQWALHS